MLPWWLGIGAAALSFAALSTLATVVPVGSPPPDQLADYAIRALLRALASYGQFLLPALFLASAATSAWRRGWRRSLTRKVTRRDAASALDDMSWREFELLVGEAFRLDGFSVAETGAGPDGGVDLILKKGGEKFLVQCKRWRARLVGVEVVRELYGVMAAKGATGGFVVTSGRFSDAAKLFAQGRDVELVEGPQLMVLLRRVRSGPAATRSRDESSETRAKEAPLCPACGSEMVLRTARRRAKAGTQFFGCTRYPGCKGTRPIG